MAAASTRRIIELLRLGRLREFNGTAWTERQLRTSTGSALAVRWFDGTNWTTLP